MKLQLRAKGDQLKVLDEVGNDIEGVVSVELRAEAPDMKPRLCLVIEAPRVFVDATGSVEEKTLPPILKGAPAAPAQSATRKGE